jgi:hypothetical protein
VGVSEAHALRGEPVKVRRAQGRVRDITLRLRPAHVVEEDENDVGFRCRRPRFTQRRNGAEQQQEKAERALHAGLLPLRPR